MIADATDEMVYDAAATVLLIGDRTGDLTMARSAIAAAGLRSLGTAPLAEGAAALAIRSGPDVVMIEARGIDPAAAARWLDPIAALARERDVGIVVSSGRGDDMDAVAAILFGAHVHHLCDPTALDRGAALRTAGSIREMRLHDTARDADDRLRQLNAEVARFADTLARLAGDGERPRFGGQVRAPAPGFRGERFDLSAPVDAAFVRDTIRGRRMRAAHFAEELFADPAWDMLLDLFAADLEGRRVSVSSLCIAAAVPGTTALRWIGAMVDAGLFERYDDPADRRRAFISLSDTARAGMEAYFEAIRRAGVMPA
ncbi:MAG: winged helix-turn-helix transcriptional regulator [Sphingomonadales bacterium]|nr:winged helix-turn-helix transcriptional regulator [Sphingomonadales bacterium]